MKLYYIAIPYSDNDKSVVETRMEQFCKLDSKLNMLGFQTISPVLKHLIFKHNQNLPTDWSFWKDLSYILLSKSDVLLVYQLNGWLESIGVQAEIEFAKQQNMPIFYINDENIDKIITELT